MPEIDGAFVIKYLPFHPNDRGWATWRRQPCEVDRAIYCFARRGWVMTSDLLSLIGPCPKCKEGW